MVRAHGCVDPADPVACRNFRPRQPQDSSAAARARAVAAVAPAVAAPAAATFAAGDRVRHEMFGFGWVESVQGKGPRERVKVKFDQDRFGTKNLVLQYARLVKVDA